MEKYIGTKIIKARPMSRGDYNAYRGWPVPDDENPDDPGYLVEYLDSPNANHPDHDGYISWSPADVFNRAYRRCDGMSFGLAVEALKMGKKVSRVGWNGPGMFLFLLEGAEVPKSVLHDPILRSVVDRQVEGDTVPMLPAIRMWTGRAVLTGWLASQTDILADDWFIVE